MAFCVISAIHLQRWPFSAPKLEFWVKWNSLLLTTIICMETRLILYVRYSEMQQPSIRNPIPKGLIQIHHQNGIVTILYVGPEATLKGISTATDMYSDGTM